MLDTISGGVTFFKNTIASDGFIILNKILDEYATRISDYSSTIIDLIITDLYSDEYKLDIDNIIISDHKQIMLNINESVAQLYETILIKKFDSKKFYISLKNSYEQNSPDNFEDIINTICSIRDLHTTVYTKTMKIEKYVNEWTSSKLKKLIRTRKKLFDLHKKFPNIEFYTDNYKHYQKLVNLK